MNICIVCCMQIILLNKDLMKDSVNIFWFRRDLRLDDNTALNKALASGKPVMPIFIFDTNITDDLNTDDARISFIYSCLLKIHEQLKKYGSSLLIVHDKPNIVFEKLIDTYDISEVYYNSDYEPYARQRDSEISNLLSERDISFKGSKDQVIFDPNEILKPDSKPYTVYTPYKNKWLKEFYVNQNNYLTTETLLNANFYRFSNNFPSIEIIGFKKSELNVKPIVLENIGDYDRYRDFPYKNHGSYAGTHLRFGTISIRKLVKIAAEKNAVYLSELIWREFFMQILYHYPYVVNSAFRKKYNDIQWINNEKHFEQWSKGETGYPIVDAGMIELNTTGNMHNRVRMICASFLVKHLLINWQWGEAYFSEKLLDYDLASNNGNWQ